MPPQVPSVDLVSALVVVGGGAEDTAEVPHCVECVSIFGLYGLDWEMERERTLPKPVWQPVPQYADVDPHHPAGLQQFPKVEPWQVCPVVPPQVASVETFRVPVGEGADEEVAV